MPSHVKLLLVENVEALGIVGDVVNVRIGYARNFLLPRELATQPSEEKVKALASKRAEAEKMLAAQRKDREQLSNKLQGVEVKLIRSCNDQGVLYGSITQQDIATALNGMGYAVKPRDVRINQVMKRVDKYEVHVKLDRDLDATLKLVVEADRKLELERQEAETKTKDGEAKAEGAEGGEAGEKSVAAPEAKAEKKEKKAKKDKPEGKKDDAAAEAVVDKKSPWSRPIDDSAKNLIPQARPRRERK